MSILTNLKQKAKQLKSEVQVLMIAYKDKRTPITAKILIGLTVGYLLSPIDLIPDFIPVLGILDDLIIVPALISLSFKLIPKTVLTEARELVKLHTEKLKKTNWVFAGVIVIVWVVAVYYSYRYLRHIFWLK